MAAPVPATLDASESAVPYFMLPQPLGQAVVDYLKQCPYVQVSGLIEALVALPPISPAAAAAFLNGGAAAE